MSQLYPQLDHVANFPERPETLQVYQDISETTKPLVDQYKKYVAEGNFSAANQYLKDHPPLSSVLINQDVFNRFEQRQWAMEDFLTTKINNYMDDLGRQEGLVVKTDYDRANNIKLINIPSSFGWIYNSDDYYYMTLSLNHCYVAHPQWSLIPSNGKFPTDAETDAYNDIIGMMVDENSPNCTITFYAENKPISDITIGVKGVD